MWNLRYNTNQHIYATKTHPQIPFQLSNTGPKNPQMHTPTPHMKNGSLHFRFPRSVSPQPYFCDILIKI